MTMKTWIWRILPLLLVALVAGVIWQNRAQRDPGRATLLACASLATGCAAQVAGRPVTVGMTGALKPLQPFQVWLEAAGARRVEARFAMVGMDMGFNLYTLRPDAQGVFRGSVTLPVCVTGRRDWVMTLEIDGARLDVPFVTEL